MTDSAEFTDQKFAVLIDGDNVVESFSAENERIYRCTVDYPTRPPGSSKDETFLGDDDPVDNELCSFMVIDENGLPKGKFWVENLGDMNQRTFTERLTDIVGAVPGQAEFTSNVSEHALWTDVVKSISDIATKISSSALLKFELTPYFVSK